MSLLAKTKLAKFVLNEKNVLMVFVIIFIVLVGILFVQSKSREVHLELMTNQEETNH